MVFVCSSVLVCLLDFRLFVRCGGLVSGDVHLDVRRSYHQGIAAVVRRHEGIDSHDRCTADCGSEVFGRGVAGAGIGGFEVLFADFEDAFLAESDKPLLVGLLSVGCDILFRQRVFIRDAVETESCECRLKCLLIKFDILGKVEFAGVDHIEVGVFGESDTYDILDELACLGIGVDNGVVTGIIELVVVLGVGDDTYNGTRRGSHIVGNEGHLTVPELEGGDVFLVTCSGSCFVVSGRYGENTLGVSLLNIEFCHIQQVLEVAGSFA